MADRHIGIIGAGVAGLSAAQRLAQAGVSSTVVDKGSRPGGRCASRITPEGFQFDHGAQYASANGAAFGAFMAAAHAAGHAARWAPAEGDGRARYVAAPTMNAIAGAFELAPATHQSWEVDHLTGAPGAWEFVRKPVDGARPVPAQDHPGGDRLGPFDAVIVTAPQPQTKRLLGPFTFAERAALDAASLAPCWSLMLAFTDVAPEPDLPSILRDVDETIGFVARQETRPRLPTTRNDGVVSLLINATPAWSKAHLELDRPAVIAQLTAHCANALPGDLGALCSHTPAFAAAHRWRYALVDAPAGQPCLPDANLGIVAAGDWCLAPRVEAAFDSGLAAAEAVLSWAAQ